MSLPAIKLTTELAPPPIGPSTIMFGRLGSFGTLGGLAVAPSSINTDCMVLSKGKRFSYSYEPVYEGTSFPRTW